METTRSYPLIAKRKLWYAISLILLIPGCIALAVWRLNVGIDFLGGTVLQVKFSENIAIESIREAAGEGASVQLLNDGSEAYIRYANKDDVDPRTRADGIITLLKEKGGEGQIITEQSFANVGGSVAKSTIRQAVLSVIITSLVIILYIAISFRRMPKPAKGWQFGIIAIIALLHDLLFVLGAFSIIGRLFPSVEVDALFITAVLTIMGFSVNDTIVVFDRLRENLRRHSGHGIAEIAEASVNQTVVRSVTTSFTVILVLLALLFLGGPSIRNFILALTLGVGIGTYSSIFTATPLLVDWLQRRK
jgi:preprotein translocase subunit SecF